MWLYGMVKKTELILQNKCSMNKIKTVEYISYILPEGTVQSSVYGHDGLFVLLAVLLVLDSVMFRSLFHLLHIAKAL